MAVRRPMRTARSPAVRRCRSTRRVRPRPRPLADRLTGVPLAAVVSSPLVRCRRTLELAAARRRAGARARSGRVRVRRLGGPEPQEAGQGAALAGGAAAPVGGHVPRRGESMAAMSARAVAAVRAWDERVDPRARPGGALVGLQPRRRDQGDRRRRDSACTSTCSSGSWSIPARSPSSRYTPGRPFLVRLNDTGAPLTALVPPKRRRRGRSRSRPVSSDAVVGGGAGAADRPGSATGHGGG